MEMQFKKALAVKTVIMVLLQSQSISYEERKFLMKSKVAIEDATTGSEAQLSLLNELYNESIKHKSCTENFEKMQEIVTKSHKDKTAVLEQKIKFDIKPIDFHFDFSKDEKGAKELYSYALELEDILFTRVISK